MEMDIVHYFQRSYWTTVAGEIYGAEQSAHDEFKSLLKPTIKDGSFAEDQRLVMINKSGQILPHVSSTSSLEAFSGSNNPTVYADSNIVGD